MSLREFASEKRTGVEKRRSAAENRILLNMRRGVRRAVADMTAAERLVVLDDVKARIARDWRLTDGAREYALAIWTMVCTDPDARRMLLPTPVA